MSQPIEILGTSEQPNEYGATGSQGATVSALSLTSQTGVDDRHRDWARTGSEETIHRGVGHKTPTMIVTASAADGSKLTCETGRNHLWGDDVMKVGLHCPWVAFEEMEKWKSAEVVFVYP